MEEGSLCWVTGSHKEALGIEFQEKKLITLGLAENKQPCGHQFSSSAPSCWCIGVC